MTLTKSFSFLMEVGSQPTLAAKLTPAIPQTQPAFLNKVSRPLY